MTEKAVRAIMGPPDAIETPEAVGTLDGKSHVEMLLSFRDKSYDDSLQRSTYRNDLDQGILSDGLRDSINDRSYSAFLKKFGYTDETPYLRDSQGVPIDEELISKNSLVAVQEAGKRWQVVDVSRDKTYEIRHAGAFFSIYQVVEYDTLFYYDCFLKVKEGYEGVKTRVEFCGGVVCRIADSPWFSSTF